MPFPRLRPRGRTRLRRPAASPTADSTRGARVLRETPPRGALDGAQARPGRAGDATQGMEEESRCRGATASPARRAVTGPTGRPRERSAPADGPVGGASDWNGPPLIRSPMGDAPSTPSPPGALACLRDPLPCSSRPDTAGADSWMPYGARREVDPDRSLVGRAEGGQAGSRRRVHVRRGARRTAPVDARRARAPFSPEPARGRGAGGRRDPRDGHARERAARGPRVVARPRVRGDGGVRRRRGRRVVRVGRIATAPSAIQKRLADLFSAEEIKAFATRSRASGGFATPGSTRTRAR